VVFETDTALSSYSGAMVDVSGESSHLSSMDSAYTPGRAAAEPWPRAQPRLLLPGARRSPWGAVVSLLLHLAVLGLIVGAHWREVLSWEELRAPGDEAPGRTGGGGGGGSVRVIAMPFSRPAPPPPAPATPVIEQLAPVVRTPDSEPLELPQTPIPTARRNDSAGSMDAGQGTPGSGGGRGGGIGTGDGSGIGSGKGPGTGDGTGGGGGKAIPPQPRQLILPPLDYPRSLRGQTVEVTFWVARDGKVERVRLEPEIEDRGFAKRFVDVMMAYRFRPGRSIEGTPTPGTTTVTVSF